MALPFDVCIRGSGIVGQTLALHLARERLRVALVRTASQSQTDSTDVRAYALNTASRALIESVRAWPEPDQATAVRHMQVVSDSAARVEFHADALGVDALTWIVDVPSLQARLGQAVAFQPLIEVVSEPVPAALTVVSEGKSSLTRAELGIPFESAPYRQHALATRVQCARGHGQVAYQWFANGEILAFLPLGGPNGNSVAVVWSVHPERASTLRAMAPDEFASALTQASHSALGQVTACSDRVVWPLVRAQAGQWAGEMPGQPGQAWVLAGDAAHAVHPLAGQGLNLGLADAAELSRVVGEREYWREVSDMRLLRRYERSRRAALVAAGGVMDGLQQAFTRDEPGLASVRNWGMQVFDKSGPLKRWVAQKAMGLG